MQKGKMLFDKDSITLRAGKSYHMVFTNVDALPHNVCIIKPGTLERVGKAADGIGCLAKLLLQAG